ncbi:MAG: type II pantothenate kinase [Ruminococcaceae bacterium]|nr:type II pantothenate kinase [Oscillospiraceae bacterium]
MSIVIGVDIGGSTTKICGFDSHKKLITPLFVKATDPLASFYGAFGKFTDENKIPLSEIDKVMITGVGSSFISSNTVYGLPTQHVEEFNAIGLGGKFLSRLENAIVVSMGTGTAIVHVNGNSTDYLGGTGMGGGTLLGLSKLLINVESIDHISALACEGDISNIDLRIADITKKDIIPNLPGHTTASNFGKVSDVATNADIARGTINLVFETIAVISIFAARSRNAKDIVLTGNLTRIPQCSDTFRDLSEMFHINFIIPDKSQYGTVIGAALLA